MLLLNKVKDHNRTSGKDAKSCTFFKELDEILGTRAASEPPLVLQSATNTTVTQPNGLYCYIICHIVMIIM